LENVARVETALIKRERLVFREVFDHETLARGETPSKSSPWAIHSSNGAADQRSY
jgi:hypothetical protein